MIEDSLNYVDSLFNRGARYLTLTWNNSTSWATSAQDESDSSMKREKRDAILHVPLQALIQPYHRKQ